MHSLGAHSPSGVQPAFCKFARGTTGPQTGELASGAPYQNSRQIAAWLATISNPEASKESRSVLNDLIEFPSVAHKDIAALSQTPVPRNVLPFSNEMTRAGVCMLGRAGRSLSARGVFLPRVGESGPDSCR